MSVPVAPIDLAVGDAMPEATLGPLTRTDFVRYAGASGDLNPIHHDETFARAAGLESVFGMGMLHAGVLGLRLARWVGPTNIRAFRVRFAGQVWPGDVLTFLGLVDSLNTDPDPLANLAMTVTRQTDDVVLRASAVVAVRAPADTPGSAVAERWSRRTLGSADRGRAGVGHLDPQGSAEGKWGCPAPSGSVHREC